nr:hypothetical protein [Pseudonocardia sp. DSM 110487]
MPEPHGGERQIGPQQVVAEDLRRGAVAFDQERAHVGGNALVVDAEHGVAVDLGEGERDEHPAQLAVAQ